MRELRSNPILLLLIGLSVLNMECSSIDLLELESDHAFSNLEYGATYSEVEKWMGSPTENIPGQESQVWLYSGSRFSSTKLVFKNGRLSEGELRFKRAVNVERVTSLSIKLVAIGDGGRESHGESYYADPFSGKIFEFNFLGQVKAVYQKMPWKARGTAGVVQQGIPPRQAAERVAKGECNERDGLFYDPAHLQRGTNRVEFSPPRLRKIAAQACRPDSEEWVSDLKRMDEGVYGIARPALVVSKTVQGMTLTDLPEKLKTVNALLSGRLPSVWPSIAIGCKSADCALARVFGTAGGISGGMEPEEAALRSLLIPKRFGYLVSLSQEANSKTQEQIWKASEVRAIDRMLSLLPKAFYRMPTMRAFYRVKDGWVPKRGSNVAAQANSGNEFQPGFIEVFGTAFNSNSDPIITLIHELAHHFEFSYARKNRGGDYRVDSGFNQLSGWDGGKLVRWVDAEGKSFVSKEYNHAVDASFVSPYAASAPIEDFAETAAFYVHVPEWEEAVAPAKYQFMRDKVFGGIEYKSLRPWPALERALAARGGWNGLLMKCMSRIDVFKKEKSGIMLWEADPRFFDNGSSSEIRLIGRRPVDALISPNCFEDVRGRLAAELEVDEQFCRDGAGDGLKDYLRRGLNKYLAPLYFAVSEQLSMEPQPDVKQTVKSILTKVKAVAPVDAALEKEMAQELQRILSNETDFEVQDE